MGLRGYTYNMRKLLLVIFPIILLVIIVVLFIVRSTVMKEPLIGGDRDQYGCLGAAGYSYDPEIGACVRLWELSAPEVRQAARVAVLDIQPSFGLSIDAVETLSCSGCFRVTVSKEGGHSILTLSGMQVVQREVLQ